jgi:hypothetical protein
MWAWAVLSAVAVLSVAGCRYELHELAAPADVDGSVTDAAVDVAGTDGTTDGARDGIYVDWPPLTPLPQNTVALSALAAYWPLDEGQGGYSRDVTGHGNDGMLLPATEPESSLAGPAWISPGFPAALFANNAQLNFDGLDDYVEFDPVSLPDIELPKSVSLWVRYDYDIQPRENAALFVLLNRSTSAGLRIELYQQRLRVSDYFMNDGAIEIVAVPSPPQNWHHIVYTFDGTIHALYVDGGQPVTSTVNTGQRGKPNRCRIGRSSSNVPDAFKGVLDDVRVYNRALTMSEVKLLHAGAP